MPRLSPAFPRLGRLTRAAALVACLAVLPTAVLGYANLLPDPFEFALLGLGAPSADLPNTARRLAQGESVRIVAFGSSSTEGVGASSPAMTYPARLEVALRKALPQLNGAVTVVNRGIGGEHVDDMLKRLDRDVIGAEPNLVIWQTGSNDPLRGVDLDHFREATIAAVRRIQEAGIDVVLMEPQWCPKLDDTPGAYRFRDAVREIGEELTVPVIRRSELMQDWVAQAKLTRKQLFSADGLHMADAGYALLARAAADEILRDLGTAAAPKVASASAE